MSARSGVEVADLVPICPLERIPVEGGVTALVDGEAVAVIRTHDDTVYALSNYDPVAAASVLARGIVGTRTLRGEAGEEEVPTVASPVYKEAYDLRTGRCLDRDGVRVDTYDARVVDGIVHVAVPPVEVRRLFTPGALKPRARAAKRNLSECD